MKRLTLKYNWLYFVALCVSLLTACEQADLATKSPMTFKNAQASPDAFQDATANARLFAMTNNEFVYGTADKGAYAQLSNFDFATDDHNATFKVKGDTRYWTTGTYNFFSAYSTRFNNTLDADNEPKFDAENSKFTFPYDITNQNEELWVAYLLNEESHISTNATVNLEFNPALAKVNFTIRKQQGNADDGIKVTSISLQNVGTLGVFNLNTAITTGNPVAWDVVGRTALNHTCDIKINETATRVTDGTSARNGGFLVIPQEVTQMGISVTYTYYSDVNCTEEEYSKTVNKALPATVNVQSWISGGNYTYNIILALETNDILFETPTVETWKQAQTGGSIIIQ